MKVQQISLHERLKRIENGEASDPDFIPSTINSLARIPIGVYMNAFPEELDNLERILGLTNEEVKAITYEEAAGRIYEIYHYDSYRHSNEKLKAYEAVIILMLPFRRCQEERRKRYEKRRKDTT